MDLREAAERDVLAVWRALSSGRSDASAGIEERDGLLLASTGVRVGFFNGAFVVGDVGAREAVDAARGFFAARDRPYLLRCRPERDDVAEAAAAAAGMREVDPLDLLALRVQASLPRAPRGLRIEPVEDAEALGVHVAVLAAAFELPVETMADFLGDVPLRDPRLRAFNGFVDGQPVTTSAAYVHDDVVGVYDVATLASHRGRGLGEALTWWAVRAGVEAGAAVATLQPSAMGLPVYNRMGFEWVAAFRQFRPQ